MEHLCPKCRVPFTTMRMSSTGLKYGCKNCGGWFTSQQVKSRAPRKAPGRE